MTTRPNVSGKTPVDNLEVQFHFAIVRVPKNQDVVAVQITMLYSFVVKMSDETPYFVQQNRAPLWWPIGQTLNIKT